MITAEPGTLLAVICHEVDRLEVGQCIAFRRIELMGIPMTSWMRENGATQADRVMENIVGSGYNLTLRICPETGDAFFCRVENTGHRTYVSVDHRPGGAKHEEFRQRGFFGGGVARLKKGFPRLGSAGRKP